MPAAKPAPKPSLLTIGLEAIYSVYITGAEDFETGASVNDFLTAGEGLDANLKTLVADAEALRSYLYGYMGAVWHEDVAKYSEKLLVSIAWAAEALLLGLAALNRDEDTTPYVESLKSVSSAIDFAHVLWKREGYNLPANIMAGDLKDRVAKEMQERSEPELRKMAVR